MAHKWAKWLGHPCRLGDPHRFPAGGKIRSGPLVGKVGTSPLPSRGSPPLQSGGQIRIGPFVGKVATSPLPSRGSPPLQSGGGNQKWPTCGQSGYVTPAASGIPTASERVGKSEVAHLWAKWVRHPCRLGDPHRFKAGEDIRSGPQVGKVATSPPPARGCPPLQRGAKSEVAHLWGKWVSHPCRLGDPHRFRVGRKIKSGPQVGKVARSPLPSRGSPPLRSGWENQKWPTCGQSGYVTPAVSGIPTAVERGSNQKWPTCGQSGYVTPAVSGNATASKRGRKSEVAHLWAKWVRHPCCLGDPHRFRAGGEIRSGPLVGKVGTSPLPSRGFPPLQSGGGHQKWPTSGQSGYVTPAGSGMPTAAEGGKIRSGPLVGKVGKSPLPSRGSPPLQSGGGNQKWPTCGQRGYVTPAVSGIPTAAERGAKSEVAHLWAKWLCHPCGLRNPHRFRARGGGGDQKWPTVGQSGYVTPAVLVVPTASERVGKSEVAHLWAKWLRHPCRLGDPHRCKAGDKIRNGPLMGKVATSPPL